MEFVDAEKVADHVGAKPFDIEEPDRAGGRRFGQDEFPPTPLMVDTDLALLLRPSFLEGAHFGEVACLGEQGLECLGIGGGLVGDAAVERLDPQGI